MAGHGKTTPAAGSTCGTLPTEAPDQGRSKLDRMDGHSLSRHEHRDPRTAQTALRTKCLFRVRRRNSHSVQIGSALPQIADIDSSREDFSVGPEAATVIFLEQILEIFDQPGSLICVLSLLPNLT